MSCVAVFLILLVLALHMSALLFVSSLISNNGIVHSRSLSPIGQNVLYCLNRYNCTFNSFLCDSVNRIINCYYSNSIEDSTFCTANLLIELISVRDGICEIAIDLNKEELQFIIDNVCTS